MAASANRPVYCAEAPASSPEQRQRLDRMKAKGAEASFTILPIMILGKPVGAASDVVGVLLERRGLQTIEIGTRPFQGGIKTELPQVAVSLTSFLKTNAITTDYALYAEYNGPSLDELRAMVVDRVGQLVWTDRLATQDQVFQELRPHRDPMGLSALLAERLSLQLRLDKDTARKRSHKLEDAWNARRGMPSSSEYEVLIPQRLERLKAACQSATLKVLGVRVNGAVNAASAADLAKRINGTGLFRSVAHVQQPAVLQFPQRGPDQTQYLWALAAKVQDYVKQNPADADYVLYADYTVNHQNWMQGLVEYILCDRQGNWVLVNLSNSDHPDYQQIKPISAEGCDTLLVERLKGELH